MKILFSSKPLLDKVTVYIDDLSIDDWSSILRSSILSVSTIYIDDPICIVYFRSFAQAPEVFWSRGPFKDSLTAKKEQTLVSNARGLEEAHDHPQ